MQTCYIAIPSPVGKLLLVSRGDALISIGLQDSSQADTIHAHWKQIETQNLSTVPILASQLESHDNCAHNVLQHLNVLHMVVTDNHHHHHRFPRSQNTIGRIFCWQTR
jgi:hypothetical protein